jgi:hypothetical protein
MKVGIQFTPELLASLFMEDNILHCAIMDLI